MNLTLEAALKTIEEETNKIQQMKRDLDGTRHEDIYHDKEASFEEILYSENLYNENTLGVDQLFI